MKTLLTLPAVLLATTYLIAAGTSSIAKAAPPSAKPNIVWIFAEDMNDWYGCYGHSVVRTPHVDQLAERGTRFTRAYMPAGVCSATRSAIALGAMQTTYGAHHHRSSRQRAPGEVNHLPAGVKSVYELMRDNGYFVTSSGMNKDDFNFIWNPEKFYDVREYRQPPQTPVWKDRKEGQPFFAQIQLKGGKNSGKWGFSVSPHGDAFKVAPYYPDVKIFREEYAHHYDCVKQTDNEVGAILRQLKQDGVLENTIVFFWTDHGMRLPRHKQWLYEGGIRVPLIVAGPGIPVDQVRTDLVSGVDISATTLALAGATVPKSMEGLDMFSPDFKREFVVSARDRCDYTIDHVRAITTDQFKYLRNFLTDRSFMQAQYRDGRPYIEVPREMYRQGKLNEVQAAMWSDKRVPEELYDLKNDPHETNNLAKDPDYKKQLDHHRQLLADWMKKTNDQGQKPESTESLRGVWKRWKEKCVNPEFDQFR